MGREQGVSTYSLFALGSKQPAPYKVQLSVGGQTLEMEIDTGASLSVISEGTNKNLVSENGNENEIRNRPSNIHWGRGQARRGVYS